MDNKDVKKFMQQIDYLEYRLHEIKALLFGTIFLIASILAIDPLLNQYFQAQAKGLVYISILLLWCTIWLVNRYYMQVNKKNTIGVVIAIYSENNEEEVILKSDFHSVLKRDLSMEELPEINLIRLKNHFSKEIIESTNQIEKIKEINRHIKAHLYIWGDIKKRKDGEVETKYFLNLQGYVTHAPISMDLSNNISRSFSKVLPSSINFLENRSLKGFEASAKIVEYASKYIIGFAAFVSNDPKTAFKLHSELISHSTEIEMLNNNSKEILSQVSQLLSDEALWLSKSYFDVGKSEDSKKYLNLSYRKNGNNYGYWLQKGMVDFIFDENPLEAQRSIAKAEKVATKLDFEWKYSKAFLYFWKQDYKKALKLCNKIKQQGFPTESKTLNDVRMFNIEILKRNPSKVQLYFWIGYLSYIKEKNYPRALQDLECFEKACNNQMGLLKQKSQEYLKDIKKIINIT